MGSKVVHPRVTAFMSHRKDILMALKIKAAASKQEAIMEKGAVRAVGKRISTTEKQLNNIE